MHSCGTPIFITKILKEKGGGELDWTHCLCPRDNKKFHHPWRKIVKIEAFLCNIEVVYYAGVECSENINKKVILNYKKTVSSIFRQLPIPLRKLSANKC
jgi:hypothetical protein